MQSVWLSDLLLSREIFPVAQRLVNLYLGLFKRLETTFHNLKSGDFGIHAFITQNVNARSAGQPVFYSRFVTSLQCQTGVGVIRNTDGNVPSMSIPALMATN